MPFFQIISFKQITDTQTHTRTDTQTHTDTHTDTLTHTHTHTRASERARIRGDTWRHTYVGAKEEDRVDVGGPGAAVCGLNKSATPLVVSGNVSGCSTHMAMP